jgi:serine phosphatase RsbU (regulator of sigma subunit)
MPALLVRVPGAPDRTVELSDQPVSLGRSETCDVSLPGDEVSREHAEVWIDEHGRVLVADKRSKNGSRVDFGEVFRNKVCAARQWLHVGEFDIEIVGSTHGDEAGLDETAVRFQPDTSAETGQRSFFPSSRGLDLNQQRLTALMSLTERIAGAFERKQLLEQALEACCESLGFERGLIVLKTARGETELPVTRNVQKDETGAYTISRTLINRALVDGERAVVNDPAVDLAGRITDSLVRFPIRSALCVPILHRDEILGVVYGDRITQASTYTEHDVDFLAAIARQVGVGIANLRMFEKQLEMQRVIEELKQARTIQRGLLPARPLRTGRIVLAGYNQPSSAVGGDYFDHFPLSDGRIGFTIADVTGHGLPAALVMANLQAAVHVALGAQTPLEDVAARLNRLVCDNTDTNVFITAIIGRIDPTTGSMQYMNAGHPAPLLLQRGDVVPLEEGHSLPLGVERDETFAVHAITPSPTLDAILLYTDGLIEACNADGDQLDIAPVMASLATADDRSADGLLRTALGVVNAHLGTAKNSDDLTLLAMQFGDAAS